MADWLTVSELLAGALASALAVLVLMAAPRRSDNQALALLLAIDGVGWLGIAGGLLDQGVAPAAMAVMVEGTLAASPWLYALFVARALDVPATRGLRGPTGTAVLLAAAVLVPILVLFVLAVVPAYQRVNDYVGLVSGPHVIIAAWALVAAIQNQRRAHDKRAARAYLDAFALRSVALLVLFGTVLVIKNVPHTVELLPLARGVAVALLAIHIAYLLYGLLSGQVLGLDDKVRVTIQKTLVLAAVATIFLVLTEGAEILVGVDSPILGIMAAGVITLAFLPIHAAADRLARRLLPDHAKTPDMPRRERVAWLQQEVGIALADGRLGDKERQMLDSTRRRLGLSEDDLEAAIRSQRPEPSAAQPAPEPASES